MHFEWLEMAGENETDRLSIQLTVNEQHTVGDQDGDNREVIYPSAQPLVLCHETDTRIRRAREAEWN